MSKSAAKAADKRHAKPQKPVRDGACVHDIGGHDEQRDRQKDETGIHPVHHDFARDSDALAINGQIGKGSDQDGIGDGRAKGGKPKKHYQTGKKGHAHAVGP